MTQEQQTALVDGQQAAVAAKEVSEIKKDDEAAASEETNVAETSKGGDASEGQAQMRALFKQIVRMRSIRRLSPTAKAAKAAQQAARAAANAAKAAEVAAKAAERAAKAAQDAAQAAFDENAKVAGEKTEPAATEAH